MLRQSGFRGMENVTAVQWRLTVFRKRLPYYDLIVRMQIGLCTNIRLHAFVAIDHDELFVIESLHRTAEKLPFPHSTEDWGFLLVFSYWSLWRTCHGTSEAHALSSFSSGETIILVLFIFLWTSVLSCTWLPVSIGNYIFPHMLPIFFRANVAGYE